MTAGAAALTIRPAGRGWRLEASLWLPRPRAEVFPFFADARNLETLTPPWVNFRILTPMPVAMRAGLVLDYRIRLHGIPVRWRTEIAEWDPPHRFADHQLRGPYRVWRHLHTFDERDGGTLCGDVVEYEVAGGALVNRLFVEPDVRRIFAYRAGRMAELFGARAAGGR